MSKRPDSVEDSLDIGFETDSGYFMSEHYCFVRRDAKKDRQQFVGGQ